MTYLITIIVSIIVISWWIKMANKYAYNGWIDRDGKLYPCDWMQHDDLAYYYFKKSVDQLEASGWIRVMRNTPGYRGRISQAQYNKCKQIGIEIPENDVLWQ